jgi:hypothetical protein
MIGTNSLNDKTKAKKERKFTDVFLTETKSKHKLIKRVMTTEWFKTTDSGKTEVRL